MTGLRVVDLFSGAGGFSLGLTEAGFEVVAAIDNWTPAVTSYAENFAHPCFQQDVSTLGGQDILNLAGITDRVDLVVGGPPCQGFSVQRIGPDHDSRNNLVLDFGRLVLEIRPRMFVMENVLGLAGKRGAATLATLLDLIEDGGYGTLVDRVDAAEWGLPQHRRRMVVIGWERETVKPFALLPPDGPLETVWQAIGDLPAATPAGGTGTDPLHVESRMSDLNRERLRHIPPGGGFEDLPVGLRVDCHKAGAAAIGHRNVYGRLHPDEPAVTITARFDSFTRGKFAHPYEDRNLTLREGARLQGFPDGFVFDGNREEIAALIGNAVPPPLARALGAQLKRHLLASRRRSRQG